MLFWIVAGALATLVALMLLRPLLAPLHDVDAPGDQAVYRGQLAEIERDVARGTLDPEEAGRVRTEVALRLLAADRDGRAPLREAPSRASLAAVAGAATVTVLGSLGLYAVLGSPSVADAPRAERVAEAAALRARRPSQAEAEARAASILAMPQDMPADYRAMVDELRKAVPQRPDDVRGWELLALHEARLGRYAAAARAQERVIALKGDVATAQDRVDLVDRMVAAAAGLVTPEAEAVLGQVAQAEPENSALLYYVGLLEAQTGRPDRAFPLWRRLVEDGPADSPHRALALAEIGDVAWRAGMDWSPPTQAAPAAGEADVDVPEDPQARTEMIRGMVEGLRERLLSDGGPAEDWARLVTSLSVLGDRDGATDALARGRGAHAGDAAALATLDAAAQRAGIEG